MPTTSALTYTLIFFLTYYHNLLVDSYVFNHHSSNLTSTDSYHFLSQPSLCLLGWVKYFHVLPNSVPILYYHPLEVWIYISVLPTRVWTSSQWKYYINYILLEMFKTMTEINEAVLRIYWMKQWIVVLMPPFFPIHSFYSGGGNTNKHFFIVLYSWPKLKNSYV